MRDWTFQVFIGHAHSLPGAYVLLFPGVCWSFSSPCGSLIPRFFPFKIIGLPLLCHNWYHWLRQLCHRLFQHAPQSQGCSHRACSEPGQVKVKPWEWSFSRSCQKCLTIISLGDGASGELQTSSAPFHGCQPAFFFFVVVRLVVFKATLELGKGEWEGTRQVKIPHSLVFLPRFSCFSWINLPWIVASLCLISRVLKKLIVTILPFIYCFYGGDRDSYSTKALTLPVHSFFYCFTYWNILVFFIETIITIH